ncbi:MAG TPA: DUF1801 domain-containing protein [Chthoniobacterales bacterium]|jgi:hypothetical protein|nr:DUF1801 domain-containing protein [Chthoniobacterales bacterium]
MKAASTVRTPAQYLAALPEERRADMTALHKAIRQAAPSLKPSIQSGMLGYGTLDRKCASGREGDAAVVGLASQKNNISLYLCVSDETGYLPEQNKDKLGKVAVGRSCIRFKKLADLNLKAAMKLVEQAARLTRSAAR